MMDGDNVPDFDTVKSVKFVPSTGRDSAILRNEASKVLYPWELLK